MDKVIELFNTLPNDCHKEIIDEFIDTLQYHLKCINMFEKCIFCRNEQTKLL